jgi:type I restriction enzyme M protein
MITGELKSQIDRVWEAFWTGGLSNPLTVIEQMTYLLFLRRLDEDQLLKEQKATLLRKPIENPIYTEAQKQLRWSVFKNLDPEIMYRLFTQPDGVFDFLKNMGGIDSRYAKFMKGATFMIPTPRLLAQVVEMLSNIDMSDRDTKGDLYEYLLSKIATAGQNGQFRTPRHIIAMMVEMTEPTPEDVICDPSAGSCGFLVGAGECVRKKYADDLLAGNLREHFLHKMFVGMEFDPTMIRIGAMNLMLHGLDSSPGKHGIWYGDTLGSDGQELPPATLILTNPPFGTKKGGGLPSRTDFTFPTSNKQFCFLQHIYRALKPGGRAAVVLPDNVLFEGNVGKQIREDLMHKCNLHTILRLPTGIFYAQGVKTNVLFFSHGTSDRGNTEAVWVYDLRANMPAFGKRTPLTREHFAAFEEAYGPDPLGLAPRTATGPEGRWQCFSREEIAARGDSLDLAWLKDDSAEDSADLPEPAELAREAMGELEGALDDLRTILAELGEEVEELA